MGTMLLEGCAGAAKMAKCGCGHEAVTSFNDVAMAQLVCCTIVCVVLLLILGALAWRLIDHHATKKVTIRKRRWDFADRRQALRNELIEKKLAAIEKGKDEKYIAIIDAAIEGVTDSDQKTTK